MYLKLNFYLLICITVVATSAKLKKLNSQFGRIAPSALLYHDTAEDPSIVTERIRQYYFNGSELTPSSGDDLERLISDRSIIHCTRKVAAAYANFTTVYAFNYTKTEPLSAGTLGLAATKSEGTNENMKRYLCKISNASVRGYIHKFKSSPPFPPTHLHPYTFSCPKKSKFKNNSSLTVSEISNPQSFIFMRNVIGK